jgi:hypothetical protein
MRLWIVSFVLLFAIAQAYDWLQQVSLPLPALGIAGFGLALLSNYGKRLGLTSWRPFTASETAIAPPIAPASAPHLPLEQTPLAIPEPSSISFVIRHPDPNS